MIFYSQNYSLYKIIHPRIIVYEPCITSYELLPSKDENSLDGKRRNART